MIMEWKDLINRAKNLLAKNRAARLIVILIILMILCSVNFGLGVSIGKCIYSIMH